MEIFVKLNCLMALHVVVEFVVIDKKEGLNQSFQVQYCKVNQDQGMSMWKLSP
jgi:hypothetical protein